MISLRPKKDQIFKSLFRSRPPSKKVFAAICPFRPARVYPIKLACCHSPFFFFLVVAMYQDYRSSRDRTTRWVHTHAPYDGDFYSPSVPPAHLEDRLVPSRPPSEAGSSHSQPPKMVLRYNDGRADSLIHHPVAEFGLSSTRSSRHGHSHSRHDPGRGRPVIPQNDQVPEEIRILPSSMRHSHVRSKSLPRKTDYDRGIHDPMPQSRHQRVVSPTQHKVTFAPPAQPSQPWHRPKQSSNSMYPQGKRPRYPSQQMYHPHQIGPNGVIYSHSAPPAGQYPQFVAPSFLHDADLRGRDFGRSGRYPANESAESLGTEKTYFVLPAHGAHSKKVHVIVSSSPLYPECAF